jgi:hydroxymethylpyrimidine/phosphomethylpyrimidine kinase
VEFLKYILTIAGSDSMGGAGIQADIKTIMALGGHALTAITAVTAQNSFEITAVQAMPQAMLLKQIAAVMADIRPDAVKIGMLANGGLIRTVARAIRQYDLANVVVDPVLKASTGRDLLESEAVALYREILLPLARVVTPNLNEAGLLSGIRVRTLKDMEKAARILKALGPDVIITGGHLQKECTDLVYDGSRFHYLTHQKIATPHTHGTGCTFSAALATFLAQGWDLKKAGKKAQQFTRAAISTGYACGQGAGPVNPFQGRR